MPIALRLGLVFLLVAVVTFCVIGFLATFEPLATATVWYWRIGYAAVAAACGEGIRMLLRVKAPKG